jgi:hypothetical protein
VLHRQELAVESLHLHHALNPHLCTWDLTKGLLVCLLSCSALEDQVQQHHRRHDALVGQLQELQAKLHAVQQQQPASVWSQASFLLFFLFFINFWGMMVSFQTVGWGLPWMAAKAAPVGALWTKQLLSVAVPLTNTLVVLIFCMQAIKAAWTCLKW